MVSSVSSRCTYAHERIVGVFYHATVMDTDVLSYLNQSHDTVLAGPVGSNHGSLAHARARGAGSPRTAQSLLPALLGRYRTRTMRAME